jgi:hypothetical protein
MSLVLLARGEGYKWSNFEIAYASHNLHVGWWP